MKNLAVSILFIAGNLSFPQQQKLNVYGFFDFEAEVSNKDAAAIRNLEHRKEIPIISIFQILEKQDTSLEITKHLNFQLTKIPE